MRISVLTVTLKDWAMITGNKEKGKESQFGTGTSNEREKGMVSS